VPRVTSDAAAHIGQRIGDERRRIGMTQDELAATSGIDSANVRAYEKGRSMPSVHTLFRIADGLGIEPSMLLAGLTLELFGRPAERRSGEAILPVKSIEPAENTSRQAR
jgi:transcriptional regulator with XRE-family HTH domain